MNKILLWFFLLIKRQLKNIVLLIFLIGLPLCAFIITHIPKALESSSPRIGIVLLDRDATSVSTADALLGDTSVFEFYSCDSAEALYTSIENGDTDCGYIFSKDLTKQLDSKSYKGCITVIKNSSEFISSLSNEILFSALFRVYGKNIAINYINESSLFSSIKASAIKITNEKYDYYVNGAATFHIDFNTLESNGDTNSLNAIAVEKSSFPVRGILSILIFVAGLFGCVQWLKDSEDGVFAPMSYSFHRISRILYIMIPTLLFAISSLITIYLANVQVSPWIELKSMFLYVLLIIVFCILLSYVIRKSTLLISLIPIFIIGSLVLCPVFINIAAFLPVANILNKLFLPYYYLMWVA